MYDMQEHKKTSYNLNKRNNNKMVRLQSRNDIGLKSRPKNEAY